MEKSSAYLLVEKEHASVLIVEDDRSLARLLETYLRQEHYPVHTAHTIPEAKRLLIETRPHLILLDLALPPTNDVNQGLDFMRHCLKAVPHAKIIIMTGEGTMDTAMTCIRQGAEDYLVKPINLGTLSVILERALKRQKLEQEMALLQKARTRKAQMGKLLGESFLMQRVFEKVRHAAQRDDNVLLLGESGTGKGVVAETLHALSGRKANRLVKVNCAALYEGLLESELFGHEKGSFTGAVGRKIGKFEYAHGGTLFLDEIGDIPSWTQAKLLHAVEDKEIQRIGGNRPIQVDTRIVAATNTNIKKQVKDERFRIDLYYRLNTTEILLPPLRRRVEDIPLLSESFLKEFDDVHYKGLSMASIEKLMQYDWPGNVRELRSVIYRAAGKAPDGGWIEPHHLEIDMDLDEGVCREQPENLQVMLENYERTLILRALNRNKGNVSKAAKELGLTRSGLHKKIARLKILKDGSPS